MQLKHKVIQAKFPFKNTKNAHKISQHQFSQITTFFIDYIQQKLSSFEQFCQFWSILTNSASAIF